MATVSALLVRVKGRVEESIVIQDGGAGSVELVQRQQHVVYDGSAGGMLGRQRQVVRVPLIARLAGSWRIVI